MRRLKPNGGGSCAKRPQSFNTNLAEMRERALIGHEQIKQMIGKRKAKSAATVATQEQYPRRWRARFLSWWAFERRGGDAQTSRIGLAFRQTTGRCFTQRTHA